MRITRFKQIDLHAADSAEMQTAVQQHNGRVFKDLHTNDQKSALILAAGIALQRNADYEDTENPTMERYGELEDLYNGAFSTFIDLCKEAGWDMEHDSDFHDWGLKATQQEIIHEALHRALESHRQMRRVEAEKRGLKLLIECLGELDKAVATLNDIWKHVSQKYERIGAAMEDDGPLPAGAEYPFNDNMDSMAHHIQKWVLAKQKQLSTLTID